MDGLQAVREFISQFVIQQRRDRFLSLVESPRYIKKFSDQLHHPEKWIDAKRTAELRSPMPLEQMKEFATLIGEVSRTRSGFVLVAGDDHLSNYQDVDSLYTLEANQGLLVFSPKCVAVVFGEYSTYWCKYSTPLEGFDETKVERLRARSSAKVGGGRR